MVAINSNQKETTQTHSLRYIEIGRSKKEERMALTSGLAGKNLGMILLGLWLILTGLLPMLNIKVSSTVTTGLAVLGIAAGILILIRR